MSGIVASASAIEIRLQLVDLNFANHLLAEVFAKVDHLQTQRAEMRRRDNPFVEFLLLLGDILLNGRQGLHDFAFFPVMPNQIIGGKGQ